MPYPKPPPKQPSHVPLFVDLHTHSNVSDGTDPPAALIRKAKAAGLSAVALTDHDTVAGCAEAAGEAARSGIDFLPGIELTCDFPRPGTFHLLGYGIDPDAPALHELVSQMQDSRDRRNQFLVDQLNAVGVRVTWDEVLEIAGPGVVGRPHFAKLLALKGYVPHAAAAYRYYLGDVGRFRFDRQSPSPGQAIEAVHRAGGVAVVAHPTQLRRSNYAQVRAVFRHLADVGLDGIEVIHPDHRESFTAEVIEIADAFGLLKTGGSDYHGRAKPHIALGRGSARRRVPRDYYDQLVRRLRRNRAA